MAELRLEGIGKRFGDIAAVAGLDLAVADGELLVLLGPTGAGKTTTLRLIAGLEALDQGRVLIGGRDVSRAPPAARDVAFVFQQFSLYPHLSVRDNLAFPLRSPLRRLPEAQVQARVAEIARLLRIEPKLANRATRLSGGEMQRVALGRALVRAPACFLMDEPLSSLDAKLREDLRVELKRIQRELGATIVYVTHDQVEAMTMADRIGVLEAGRLLQLGTPREIYTRPASLAVARRLGSPPINLLPPGFLPVAAPAGTSRLGIRPEDVHLDGGHLDGGHLDGGHLDGTGTPATIEQVEALGAETVVLLRAGELRLHALVAGETALRPGAATALRVPPEAVLFFAADGQAVARSPR